MTQFLSVAPPSTRGSEGRGGADAGDCLASENATRPAKAGVAAIHAVPWMKPLRPILMLLLRLSSNLLMGCADLGLRSRKRVLPHRFCRLAALGRQRR